MTSRPQFPRIEWYQAGDGRRLVVRVWRTTVPPRARVVLLHGVLSHGGWYSASCAYLSGSGSEVHFLERRGSGINVDFRGDVDRWPTWPEDVESYLNQLPTNCPRVLGGISWGGKLAAAVARRHSDLVDGLILICPGIYAHQQPGRWQKLALQLARIPRIGSRYVPVPLEDAGLFTDHVAHRQFVARDPLALRQVTLRFALADQQLTQFAREAPSSLHMPTLLVLAGRDPIVENASMREYFRALAARDTTLHEYPDATHTLEFDPAAQSYMQDLARWIEHLSP
jgi:alpha-beta hydrolase superfamily lysophospholipase